MFAQVAVLAKPLYVNLPRIPDYSELHGGWGHVREQDADRDMQALQAEQIADEIEHAAP
ncbi:hypothetical protein [Bailinhaonella thermotolerans]|uniref:hypothetical protein n=1 Tax=Bailinhaonella thermotolerans TaxID=1070861 RepID=UPI00192A6418|nr:hypothetical protein [Bailinhaonella thermotolerans]